jgi:hypothetical protein
VALVAIVDPEPQSGRARCRLRLAADCLREVLTRGSSPHLAMLRHGLARRAAALRDALRSRLRPARKVETVAPKAANSALNRAHLTPPGSAYRGPVVAFCSGTRAYAPPDAFVWSGRIGGELSYVRLRDVSTCLQEPGVQAFAAALEATLARAERAAAPIPAVARSPRAASA